MTKSQWNGWLRYWPVLVIIGTAIGGYAVMCDTVWANKEMVQKNEARIVECEKSDIRRERDIAHIREQLDKFIVEQRAVNTQVVEYLRTTP